MSRPASQPADTSVTELVVPGTYRTQQCGAALVEVAVGS